MIIRDGMRRMYRGAGGRLLLHHPDERELPAPRHARRAARRASSRACTCCSEGGKAKRKAPRVQLMGSGTILREVIAAADLLRSDFGVDADVWSATSFNELRRDGMASSAGTCCIRPSRARKSYRRDLPRRPRRPGHRRDRLHAHLRRPGRAAQSRGATSCSAPMASAAATIASSCAVLRGRIATTWPSRR